MAADRRRQMANILDNLETLLHQDTIGYCVLHCDLDFYPPGVWLCPYETGINDSDFSKAPQLLQTQRQQLSGLGLGCYPACGRLEPSIAVSAKVDDGFTLDALGDVVSELDTVVAEGAGGGRSVDGGTTVAAKNPVFAPSSQWNFSCTGTRTGAREGRGTYVAPVMAVPPWGAMETAPSISISMLGYVGRRMNRR